MPWSIVSCGISFRKRDFMTYALECPVYFLGEQQTGLYIRYCSEAAQLKNALGAKSVFISQALSDLERSGA